MPRNGGGSPKSYEASRRSAASPTDKFKSIPHHVWAPLDRASAEAGIGPSPAEPLRPSAPLFHQRLRPPGSEAQSGLVSRGHTGGRVRDRVAVSPQTNQASGSSSQFTTFPCLRVLQCSGK
ncbi:hypothetical protein BU26DRAFT_44361 [Trematosphaeria pertusa]|uniref:Uncharacterized protein n=1 Tax=Trematosphaeria pertusa TaxID=390896 RepID=A0A6A6J4W0_9PLEO|nr:uncharacterized protein BU26DRAFT_44361 [Trematosphaeria pertusa]KAF2257471.1 hypothetical protein BU26DRAFT_44361 [Trematosphaeria pertusa]